MTIEVAVANLSGHTCWVESSDGTHMIGLGAGQVTRLHIWKGKSIRVYEAVESFDKAENQET